MVQTLLVSILGVTVLLLLTIFLQVNAGQTFNVSLQERLPCCHFQIFLYGQTIHCLYFRSNRLIVVNNLSKYDLTFTVSSPGATVLLSLKIFLMWPNIHCLYFRIYRLFVANNLPYVVKTFTVSISGVIVLLSLTIFLMLSLFEE
jgi:hypothetical protein